MAAALRKTFFFLLAFAALTTAAPASQAGGMIPYIADRAEMQDILQSTPVPVVVQFDAGWCGYCRALAPTMDALHRESSTHRVAIYKVDFDAAPDLVQAFGVTSLPTIFVFYRGEIVATRKGGGSLLEMTEWIRDVRRNAGA